MSEEPTNAAPAEPSAPAEPKIAALGTPEAGAPFEPGDVAEEPEKADLSDPETFRAFATPERDYEDSEDDEEEPSLTWDDIKRPEPVPIRREARLPEVKTEPKGPEITEALLAEIEAEAPPPRPKVIKNPAARARILEKEVHAKDTEISELKSKVNRILEAIEGKGTVPDLDKKKDSAEDEEDIPIGLRILKNQEEDRKRREVLEQELLAFKREKQMEKEMVAAENKLRTISTAIENEQKENPVFVDALNHVARAMYYRVHQLDEFGKTEEEKKQSFARLVLSKQLEWADKHLDPVQEMFNTALGFGFDHIASARHHGVVFEGMEEEMAPTPPKQAAAAVKQAVAAKPDPRAELALAKKRSEGTGTISGLTGKAPKRFSAKNMMGKSDEEFRYEAKRALATGELGKPGQKRVTYDDLMMQVAEER